VTFTVKQGHNPAKLPTKGQRPFYAEQKTITRSFVHEWWEFGVVETCVRTKDTTI